MVFARRTADVSSEVTGVLRRCRVSLGDRVAAGQIIASLGNTSLRQDLAAAEAALRATQAQENKATVELNQARQILERRKQMEWALSKEELEILGAREELARAGLEVARSQSAEQAARVQKTRESLAKCEIRAPFPGRIGRIQQSEGTLVTPGVPVARVVADADLWVRFAVPPGEAPSLAPGMEASLALEESGRRAPIRIEHVAPEVDAAAGMVFVEARVVESPLVLAWVQPGMVGRVHLLSGR